MAPSPQVIRAFQAMSAIGLSEQQVKPVLKSLVKLYNKDWSLIEAEEYRALADAIFEAEDAKAAAKKKTCNSYEEDMEADSEPLLEPERLTRSRSRSQDESSSQKKKFPDGELADNEDDDFLVPYRPLKRIRLQNRESPVSPSSNSCNPMFGGTSLIEPKVEAEEVLDTHSAQQPQDTSHSPELRPPVSPHSGIKDKGKKPLVSKPLALQGKSLSERSSNGVRFKETMVEPGNVLLPKQKANSFALIQPKDEPFTDDMAQDKVPIAVIHPACADESDNINSCLLTEGATGNQYDEPAASHERESRNDNPNLSSEGTHGSMNNELATIPEGPPSNSGESSCLEVASSSSSSGEDGSINVAPNLDSLQKSPAWDAVNGNKETLSIQSRALNGPIVLDFPGAITDSEVPRIPFTLDGDNPQLSGTFVSNGSSEDHVEDSLSLVVVQNADLTPDDLRAIYDINDIARGGERVKISWVNERSRDRPSSFFYISKNVVFKDADVKVRLSSIEDKNCCATCFGDCVSAKTPCACAYETRGKFAYTPDGLIKDDLLEECISMTRNPQPHHLFYCKNCPLERIKNDDCLESCKGHLRRTFIKECWIRCGCHGQCGNRVVQRGLNCSLQVFFTSEGKGWGLRTLDDLPKGAFVCEFVGEVLTNKERHQRKIQCTRSGKCPSLVLLDADWGSKANLRDEEALCLDATNYGNVARFINHRCLDANLVLIPVEVESPDRHSYHVAFFTTRKVDALEELTWDYGIDFDDHDDPVKVFNCICASKFCRNMTRSNRSRSASHAR